MPPAGPLAEVRVQVRRSAFSGTFVGDRQLAVTLQDTPDHAQMPDQSARSPVPLPPSGWVYKRLGLPAGAINLATVALVPPMRAVARS
jgi:hypothetical protein